MKVISAITPNSFILSTKRARMGAMREMLERLLEGRLYTHTLRKGEEPYAGRDEMLSPKKLAKAIEEGTVRLALIEIKKP